MELNDVECATLECTAVGWYWSWGLKPLAERINLGPLPSPQAPDVVTDPGATAVTAIAATVWGTVNPHSATVTDCHFEYGTDTGYGQAAACKPANPGSGGVPVQVSAALTDLQPGTTYHFRLVAANTEGTAYGADQTFVTSAAPCASETCLPESAAPTLTLPPSTGSGGAGESTKQVYASCVARARRQFRSARRAALRKYGAARKAALARAGPPQAARACALRGEHRSLALKPLQGGHGAAGTIALAMSVERASVHIWFFAKRAKHEAVS